VRSFVPIAPQRRALGRIVLPLGGLGALGTIAVTADRPADVVALLASVLVGAAFTAWISYAFERRSLEERADRARPAPAEALVEDRPRLPAAGPALLVLVIAAWPLAGVALLGDVAFTMPAVLAGLGAGSLLVARWASRWESARGARLLIEAPAGFRWGALPLYVRLDQVPPEATEEPTLPAP
jgi:hypothetical protein